MANKKKYKFNHDTELISEGLGITDERFDEIAEIVRKAYYNEKDFIHAFEHAFNAAQPKSLQEAAMIGFCVGILNERQIQEFKKLEIMAAVENK